jgi:UPF0755 protein
MKRLVVQFVVALLAAGLALVAWLGWYSAQPLALGSKGVEFTLAPGTPMKLAARQIQAAGVPVQPLALEWMARMTGKDRAIKAGSYEFTEGLTPWSLLLKLTRGDVTQAELTIVEGWTFRQLRAAMEGHPDLGHDSLGLTDQEVLARLGAPESNPEGLFMPDTYLFSKRSSDLHLLRRAYRAMQGRLVQAWGVRRGDLPLATPYEALILASIVEKETGRREDRPLVASVFINRLRAGMRLQTDPTVIYGIGPGFDGNLTRRNLQTDGPYNTYLRLGLPPTPIALPGADALRAALQAPATEFLYFVARGDGSSEFSKTLDDHNRAVARFQKRN